MVGTDGLEKYYLEQRQEKWLNLRNPAIHDAVRHGSRIRYNGSRTPRYTSRGVHMSVVHIAGFITNQSTPAPGCAAILILNCLCLCLACSSSLSTAYCNRSFLALICFSLSTSLSLLSPLSLALFFPPLNEVALLASSPLEDKRPSRSSHRAIRACSRRSRRSSCNSHRASREFISGVRDAKRSRWAD